MCESLHSNSPLHPLDHKHNSYIPMTLNSYITYPIVAGPGGLWAHMDDPQGLGKSQSGPRIACSNTTSHSYCQKSKMVTVIICLTHTKNFFIIYRFTHYFHFPPPSTLFGNLLPPLSSLWGCFFILPLTRNI